MFLGACWISQELGIPYIRRHRSLSNLVFTCILTQFSTMALMPGRRFVIWTRLHKIRIWQTGTNLGVTPVIVWLMMNVLLMVPECQS